MTTVLLDPTPGGQTLMRRRVPGAPSLESLRVGLLDIRKRQGDKFLDRLEELLRERGIQVGRYAKPTYTKHAPPQVIDSITADCDAVVEGLAD